MLKEVHFQLLNFTSAEADKGCYVDKGTETGLYA